MSRSQDLHKFRLSNLNPQVTATELIKFFGFPSNNPEGTPTIQIYIDLETRLCKGHGYLFMPGNLVDLAIAKDGVIFRGQEMSVKRVERTEYTPSKSPQLILKHKLSDDISSSGQLPSTKEDDPACKNVKKSTSKRRRSLNFDSEVKVIISSSETDSALCKLDALSNTVDTPAVTEQTSPTKPKKGGSKSKQPSKPTRKSPRKKNKPKDPREPANSEPADGMAMDTNGLVIPEEKNQDSGHRTSQKSVTKLVMKEAEEAQGSHEKSVPKNAQESVGCTSVDDKDMPSFASFKKGGKEKREVTESFVLKCSNQAEWTSKEMAPARDGVGAVVEKDTVIKRRARLLQKESSTMSTDNNNTTAVSNENGRIPKMETFNVQDIPFRPQKITLPPQMKFRQDPLINSRSMSGMAQKRSNTPPLSSEVNSENPLQARGTSWRPVVKTPMQTTEQSGNIQSPDQQDMSGAFTTHSSVQQMSTQINQAGSAGDIMGSRSSSNRQLQASAKARAVLGQGASQQLQPTIMAPTVRRKMTPPGALTAAPIRRKMTPPRHERSSSSSPSTNFTGQVLYSGSPITFQRPPPLIPQIGTQPSTPSSSANLPSTASYSKLSPQAKPFTKLSPQAKPFTMPSQQLKLNVQTNAYGCVRGTLPVHVPLPAHLQPGILGLPPQSQASPLYPIKNEPVSYSYLHTLSRLPLPCPTYSQHIPPPPRHAVFVGSPQHNHQQVLPMSPYNLLRSGGAEVYSHPTLVTQATSQYTSTAVSVAEIKPATLESSLWHQQQSKYLYQAEKNNNLVLFDPMAGDNEAKPAASISKSEAVLSGQVTTQGSGDSGSYQHPAHSMQPPSHARMSSPANLVQIIDEACIFEPTHQKDDSSCSSDDSDHQSKRDFMTSTADSEPDMYGLLSRKKPGKPTFEELKAKHDLVVPGHERATYKFGMPEEPPAVPYELIDIAAILTHPKLRHLRMEKIIQKATKYGVKKIIIPGLTINQTREAAGIAVCNPGKVYFLAGVHPHNASSWNSSTMDQLEELIHRPECVGLGECGLDFNRNFSPGEDQVDVFRRQIIMACETKKPLLVHSRDALTLVLGILQEFHNMLPPVVIHCFSGSEEDVQRCLDMGFYLGLTGVIARDTRMQELLKNRVLPLSRIMLETDSPFMRPFADQIMRLPRFSRSNIDFLQTISIDSNEPASLHIVCEIVASCLNVTPEEVASATTQNAMKFFKFDC